MLWREWKKSRVPPPDGRAALFSRLPRTPWNVHQAVAESRPPCCRAPETAMRSKKATQSQIGFLGAEGNRTTLRYFDRYQCISALLDRHPEILAAVHVDLERPLEQANRHTRSGRPSKHTSETVLRIALVRLIEDCSFRELQSPARLLQLGAEQEPARGAVAPPRSRARSSARSRPPASSRRPPPSDDR